MAADARFPLKDLREVGQSLGASRLLLVAETTVAAVVAALSIVFATSLR